MCFADFCTSAMRILPCVSFSETANGQNRTVCNPNKLEFYCTFFYYLWILQRERCALSYFFSIISKVTVSYFGRPIKSQNSLKCTEGKKKRPRKVVFDRAKPFGVYFFVNQRDEACCINKKLCTILLIFIKWILLFLYYSCLSHDSHFTGGWRVGDEISGGASLYREPWLDYIRNLYTNQHVPENFVLTPIVY